MIALVLAAATLATQQAPSSTERAWRACIDRTTTNYDWGQCGVRYIDRADGALDRAWKKLMTATDGKTRADLVAEQQAWLAYRKAACNFYANGDWGREGQVLHYAGCVASVIERRTRELADYLDFIGPK